MAKRTQYYCPFLTPSALPPLLSREFPRTSAGGRWRPPCQRGLAALADWGIPTGCAWPPIPGQPPHAKRGGLPSSLAPLARDPFTAVRRGRACPALHLAITTPFIFCIVGRGLDRLTAHNERRQPAKLARSCGCLPCRGKHCSLPDFAPLNRGPTLTTPHLRGASGTPPPTTIRRASHYRKRPRRPGGRPPYIPLYHIPWGGPSPATLPLPPRILCIVGRQATGPLHNRPAP